MRLPQLAPSIRDRSRSLILLIIVAMLIAVGLKVSFELLLRSIYELSGAFTGDTPIYWAIGRGLFNGRMPYVDLWESKPPGIFLLSAFSILLTGDQSFGHALQTLLILAIPISLAGFVFLETRDKGREERTILTLFAFGLGAAIALFMAERSGEYQVESFGGAFGALYAIWSARRRSSWNRIDTGVAAALLLASIGMKEPFLFSTAAAALVVARSWEDLRTRFLMPLGVAAAVGIAVMGALGMLIPYLSVYLPIMLGTHVQNYGSPWERGLHIERLYDDLQGFVSPLGDLAVLLIIAAASFHIAQRTTWTRRATVVVFFGIAVYLTSFGVGLGGEYWNHHFAVLIPPLTAAAALTLLGIASGTRRTAAAFFAITVMVLMAVAIARTPRPYVERYPWIQNDLAVAKREAQYLDRILTACALDRYLFFGGNGPHVYGFTKHSPEGPFFWMFEPPNDYARRADKPFLRNRFFHTLDEARIAVVDRFVPGELMDTYERYIHEHFTEEPWPCTRRVPGQSRYRIFYRKL